ncbi:hypothetical protein [Enterococcus mundtii]|uniref:hypothetical protein n=1 Tax=Enterococcus mundtii TaxID=53346 RepID=UPI002158469C|nr:hypothetical protein [Enterococcus mundtii]
MSETEKHPQFGWGEVGTNDSIKKPYTSLKYDVQVILITQGREKKWVIKQIVYLIQSGCANTTLYSHQSIEEKSAIINIEQVNKRLSNDYVSIKEW